MSNQKIIALVDCDNFFVSCERVATPEFIGKPLCVVSGKRGCVISRSREAKMMGLPMGIPLFQAVEQFPDCIYLTANHYRYSVLSNKVMNILKDFSPCVEIYSIDEAFVDFSGLCRLYKKNYYELAKMLQKKVFNETGIPISIGVSVNKTLAKLASDKAKNLENHILLLGKSKIEKFLKNTDIEEVWGIGRRLSKTLNGYAIKSAYDYISKDEEWIKRKFGKNGIVTYCELKGIKILNLEPESSLPKSISESKAFPEFSDNIDFIKNELLVHIHETCRRLRKISCKTATIGVFLKTKDFYTNYLKENLDFPTDFEFDVSNIAFKILDKLFEKDVKYRSVGIVLENFSSLNNEQLKLFNTNSEKSNTENLGKSLDKLEKKYGKNIVRTGFTHKKVDFKQGFLTSPKDVD